jgi:DNA-binding PadR family transcriptional regulator
MVLGTLARRGQLHGHQIRRAAEVTNVGEWGGVSVGALYRELRTMEGEGLVEPVRTEKVGRRPARTVYAITEEGRLELEILRERAASSTDRGQDPLGVALLFTGTGDDQRRFANWMQARRERLDLEAAHIADERRRVIAAGYLDEVSAAVMRRGEMHLDTEVRWHDEFAKLLAAQPGAGHEPGAHPERDGNPEQDRHQEQDGHQEEDGHLEQDRDGPRRGKKG